LIDIYDQKVESCNCVDEETGCTGVHAQVLSDSSEQFAMNVSTDTGESCRTRFLPIYV